jgi:hypothetical protein
MDGMCGVLHTSHMQNRKPLAAAIFIPVLIGSIGISNIAGKPRFETFHAVDVLQLIGSGMCFGVALFALVLFLRGRRTP